MSPNFVGKNIARGLLGLLLLLGVSFVLGVYFETHIQEFSEYFISEYHPFYLLLFVFFNDVIISPVPPDIFLLFIAKAKNYPHRELIVLGLGVASTLAGIMGWFLASKVIKADWLGKKFTKYMAENESQMRKFGKWMVALGALTPIPYSMTCWAAGVIKMPLKDMALMASLRIARFFIYYYLLLWSDKLPSLF